MSIVLGYEYPTIRATLANRVVSLTLPLTNLNGRQIEDYEVSKIRHYLQGFDILNPVETIVESIKGYRISWTMSHSDFIEGEDVEIFDTILRLHKAGYTLQLTPRADQAWRFFTVIPDNETLSLGVDTGGSQAIFNTDWVFRLITTNLEQDLKLQQIVPASTYATITDNTTKIVLIA